MMAIKLNIFIFEPRDIAWWYWLVTAILLTVGVSGENWGVIAVLGLTVFQLMHYIVRKRGVTSFPVQVRFWYLVLLAISVPESMQWLYWLPCIGTWAQVLFSYCAMARIVSLFPWNRQQDLSLNLLNKTFLSRPEKGTIN
jgi:hypothetical protein